MTATETRRFTIEDMEEIRPGVFKLKGYHVYVANGRTQETCEACQGKGKVQGTSNTGRKTWVHCQCNRGRGKFGKVDLLTNVARSVPKANVTMMSMSETLESAVQDLNDSHSGKDIEKYPIFIRLWG